MVDLATPLVLPSGLSIRNRIAKAAMTEGLATTSGLPSPDLLRLYRRWASSEAGLLVTGNVGICADHPVRPGDVILREGVDLAPFSEWARVSGAGGARVVMQLNHGGRQTPRMVNPRPLAPSSGAAVKVLHSFGEPREATRAEIADVVRRHGEAAALAERAGFDGVQVHAAHGYLLNQFLAPDVNRREDAWGGDVKRRARLLVECVRATRAATSKRFSILVKLNAADFHQGGFSEDESIEVVSLLDAEGIDLLEISGGRYESGASFGHASKGPDAREAYFIDFSARAKKAIRAPLMLTGGLRSRGAMEAALSQGATDLVGIARPMVLVPDYPKRLLEGSEVPTVRAKRIGIAALASFEGAAELAWYYMQLARVARGKDPDPHIGALRALLWFLGTDMTIALRRRFARSRAPSLPPPVLVEKT